MKKIALDPKNGGGMCISPAALKLGDLIVSTTGANVSTAIRVGTGSPVSHAMLFVGGGQVIEAVGTGVRRVPLGTAINDASLAVAYRVPDLSEKEGSLVVNFAVQQIGRKYNTSGAAGAGVARNPLACAASGVVICVAANAGMFSSGGRFYCSELVLAAYVAANRPLVPRNPSVSVPNDIPLAYSHGTLVYAGHVVV